MTLVDLSAIHNALTAAIKALDPPPLACIAWDAATSRELDSMHPEQGLSELLQGVIDDLDTVLEDLALGYVDRFALIQHAQTDQGVRTATVLILVQSVTVAMTVDVATLNLGILFNKVIPTLERQVAEAQGAAPAATVKEHRPARSPASASYGMPSAPSAAYSSQTASAPASSASAAVYQPAPRTTESASSQPDPVPESNWAPRLDPAPESGWAPRSDPAPESGWAPAGRSPAQPPEPSRSGWAPAPVAPFSAVPPPAAGPQQAQQPQPQQTPRRIAASGTGAVFPPARAGQPVVGGPAPEISPRRRADDPPPALRPSSQPGWAEATRPGGHAGDSPFEPRHSPGRPADASASGYAPGWPAQLPPPYEPGHPAYEQRPGYERQPVPPGYPTSRASAYDPPGYPTSSASAYDQRPGPPPGYGYERQPGPPPGYPSSSASAYDHPGYPTSSASAYDHPGYPRSSASAYDHLGYPTSSASAYDRPGYPSSSTSAGYPTSSASAYDRPGYPASSSSAGYPTSSSSAYDLNDRQGSGPRHSASGTELFEPRSSSNRLWNAVKRGSRSLFGRGAIPAAKTPATLTAALTQHLGDLRSKRSNVPPAVTADLLADALRSMAKAELDLPPGLLEDFTLAAREYPQIGEALSVILGEAPAEPEQQPEPPLDTRLWTLGDVSQRQEYLRGLRQRDPIAARDLVVRSWPSLLIDEKEAFIQVIADHPQHRDQPLLELAYADPSGNVRAAARSGLAHLPDSSYASRIRDLAAEAVSVSNGHLRTLYPQQVDPRDGLDDIPYAADPGATRLNAVVAALPPSAWEWLIGCPAPELAALPGAHEIGPGLEAAAIRYEDSALADALLQVGRASPDLVTTASPVQQTLVAAGSDGLPDWYADAVESWPQPWPNQLAGVVSRYLLQEFGHVPLRLWLTFAARVPDHQCAEMANRLRDGIPEYAPSQLTRMIRQVAALIATRATVWNSTRHAR